MAYPLPTPEQAQQFLEWASRQPALMEIYSNPLAPGHETAQKIAKGMYRFAYEYPQGPDGKPLPLDAVYGPRSAEQDRAGDLEGEIELARFASAIVGDEHPLNNPAHPDHQAAHGEMLSLYRQLETAEQNMAASVEAGVVSPTYGGTRSPARQELDRIRAELAGDPSHPYHDKHHPDHPAAGARVMAAYRAVHGIDEEAASQARLSTLRQQLLDDADLRGAYLDSSHPRHSEVTGRVEAAYREAFPSAEDE